MTRIVILAMAVALSSPAVARDLKTGAWQIGDDGYHLYYQDLDVTTIAGRAALLRRVEAVAKRLCRVPLRDDERECIRATVARIDKPEIVRAIAER